MDLKRRYTILGPGKIRIVIITNVSGNENLDLPQNLMDRGLGELGFTENQVGHAAVDVFLDGPFKGQCYVELQIEHDLDEEELLRRFKEKRYEEMNL